LVEAHVLAPVNSGLWRWLRERALVDADFEAPLMVDTHDADQREFLARCGFQFGDVEQEGGVAGKKHDRSLCAVCYRSPHGVGQAGAQMAEVLVPDDVAGLALRIGPSEYDGRAAVADHDAVCGERLGGLDDEARGMD